MTKLPDRTLSVADLEVRTDQRIIVGIAVPFDARTVINSRAEGQFAEVFRHGALAKTITQRGNLD